MRSHVTSGFPEMPSDGVTGAAKYIASLLARHHGALDLQGGAASPFTDLLEHQIGEAIEDLLDMEPATLSDALALSWLVRSGLTLFSNDAETGDIGNFRGLEMAYRANENLDRLLVRLGAERSFAIAAGRTFAH
jgi:hypothetical protein